MSMEFLGKINELLALGAKPISIVCVVCWVLVLLPDGAATVLGVGALRAQFRAWIGMGALISSVWLAMLVAWDLAARAKTGREHFHILKTLAPGERNLLRNYLTNNTTTMSLDYGHGLPMGLVRKGVLYLPNEAAAGFYATFNIEPWAWETLRKYPHLVKE